MRKEQLYISYPKRHCVNDRNGNRTMDNHIQRLLTLAFLAGILLIPALAIAASFDDTGTPGRVIVGYKTPSPVYMQVAAVSSSEPIPEEIAGAAVVETCEPLNAVIYAVNDTDRFIAGMAAREDVAFVEPDHPVYACTAASFLPNDPYYPLQWAPAAIGADEAWSLEQGDRSVVIAIVDSGVDYAHPDLAANYLSGGYDWVNGDADPRDDNGHGTHCAGIAAATINNSAGIAGIAQVSILAEKVLDAGGSGYASTVASGITHAVDNGADIISLSLGSSSPSTTLQEACRYAWDNGCLVVAASGNGYGSPVLYPAAFETVIAVGSLDSNNALSSFSNYGSEQELVAPGSGIYSTWPGGQYKSSSGTSMATPFVAGVSALVKSRYPDMTNAELRSLLAATADDLGAAGRDSYYGYGRVDAFEAVVCRSVITLAESTVMPASIPNLGGSSPGVGETTRLTATVTGDNPIATVTIDLSPLGGAPAVAMDRSTGATWVLNVSSSVPSPYVDGAYRPFDLALTATDIYGCKNTSATIPLLVIRNGDVTRDNRVTLYDALYTARHLLGTAGYENIDTNIADVTNDGTVGMPDAMYLAKHALRMPGFLELH